MKQFLAALIFSPVVAFAGNGAGTMSHTQEDVEQSVIFLGETNESVIFDLSLQNRNGLQIIRHSLSVEEVQNSYMFDSLRKSVESGQWETIR